MKILPNKKVKFIKSGGFFIRSLPGLSCQAALPEFLPHIVCFPTAPWKCHRKTKKNGIFMWSLKRCKTFWFLEERQGKKIPTTFSSGKKYLWSSWTTSQLPWKHSSPLQPTMKTACSYHGGRKHQLDKMSLAVCCHSCNADPVFHHQQHFSSNTVVLLNSRQPNP